MLPAQPRDAQRALGERYGARDGQLRVFGRDDWMAPIASGSNPADAMADLSVQHGNAGAIAGGLADNLIERAADVMLKERRPLVLVPRETPLSAIHLENMLDARARRRRDRCRRRLAFYTRPQNVDDLVDFVVARVLDQLGVAHALGAALGRARGDPPPTSSAPDGRIPPRRPRAHGPLPIFPLRTVLFPGGLLPLKVFEQRYIDMAKECLAGDRPFGVCLITQGDEVAPSPARARNSRRSARSRASPRGTCRSSASCT